MSSMEAVCDEYLVNKYTGVLWSITVNGFIVDGVLRELRGCGLFPLITLHQASRAWDMNWFMAWFHRGAGV